MELESVVEAGAPSDGWAALNSEWLGRTRLAAEWLQGEAVILDAGCGLMRLETHLPPSSTYIPMDLVRRDNRTILIDLDRDNIPRISCDVIVLLGVLEYLDNLPALVRQLRQFPKAIVSYNHVSLNDVLWAVGARSKVVTWRNRRTKSGFHRLLQESGLRVARERRVRMGERLYQLTPA